MMRDSRLGAAPFTWLFFLSAIAGLASAPALAASSIPVNGQLVFQPITMCAANCGSCAPVNDLGQTSSPAYIGAKDPTTGNLVTDELLATVLGYRPVYLPLKQYCSPNTNNGGPWGTLHLTSDLATPPNYTCSDCMTLFQQPGIANNFKVPNPTTPPGGTTPCGVDANGILQPPCLPLSTTVTVSAMIFAQSLKAVNFSAVPYGFAMLNGVNLVLNAGSSIPGGTSTTNTIVGGIFNPPSPTRKQLSVPSHEVAHTLGLPHITSALSGLTCLPTVTNPNCDLMAPGGTRFEDLPSSFYMDLAAGNVDHLVLAQQTAVQDIDPRVTPIQHVTTTIVADPARGTNFFDYSTTVVGDTNSTALLTRFIFIFENPKGFQPSSFTIISAPSGVTVTGSNFNGSPGNGILCGTADQTSSVKCWDIEISPGLSSGQTLSYALAVSASIKNPTLSLLEGQFAYFFNDQLVTTSNALPNNTVTVLTADSVNTANLGIPLFLAQPGSFVGTGVPCRVNLGDGSCPTVGIGD